MKQRDLLIVNDIENKKRQRKSPTRSGLCLQSEELSS